jgi:hypothetical protein
MTDYTKYLGIKHDYSTNNCITIISDIYKQELNSNVFDSIWEYTGINNGVVEDGRNWRKRFSIKSINNWASKVATKVILTNVQEYDVILFRSGRFLPTHFGMYIHSNKFIHLAEGKYSTISLLNADWREQIDSIWHWNGLKTTRDYPLNT